MESGSEKGWLTPERERRLLILLFLVGFLLRAYPILWSSAHYDPDAWGFHPDEPKLVRHVDDFPESIHTYNDYRYPTLIPFTYGVVWMGVGSALDLRDPGASMPGSPSYEAALLFSRALTVLLFGLGGMWLTWAFTKRLFGPGPALFALAATNLMGLPMTSASLVQTDVPAAVLLLAVFHLLARFTSGPELLFRDFFLVGLALGAAAAAKYTAVIGALVVVAVVVGAVLRGDTKWRMGIQLVGTTALASAIAFLIFVPGVLYDFEAFRGGLNYELHSKVLEADVELNKLWSALSKNYPLWVLIPALLGLVIAFSSLRTVLLSAIVGCMAVFALIWTRSLMPDHAIMFFPYVAAFAGLGLWRASLLQPRRVALLALTTLLFSGHAYSGWVVQQRYEDIRYELVEWLHEKIPEGGAIGISPDPQRLLSHYKPPAGYKYVKARSKPEWVVVHKRHYNLFLRFTEDPEQYKKDNAWRFETPEKMEAKLSLETGARKMGRLEEVDFRFFEDVMGREGLEFKYDEALRLESKEIPLDHQSRPIYVFRRLGTGGKRRR